MTINNKRTAFKARTRSLFLTIFVALLIIVILVSGWFDNPILGLEKNHYTLIILAIYFLISIYYYFLDLNYIFYNDDGDKIVLKFSSLRIMSKVKKAYEIPKQKFLGYQVIKTFFGLKKSLILFQYQNNKKAKYPPVSISSLTKNELTRLISSLRKNAGNKI